MRLWLPVLLGTFALGGAWIVQQPGCTEGGHYALLRSIADGNATIDRYHWSTCDTSWYRGHFYTAKGPGLALASLPLYVVLQSAGAVWNDVPQPDGHLHAIPGKAVWPFTAAIVTASAVGLLLLMRRAAIGVAAGYATIAAVALALGTMLLPYATLYASHVPATMLGFAAFVVLLEERRRAPSLVRVALAGLLAGLSLVFDLPLGLVAVLLAVYAVSRRPILPRGLAYAVGGVVGVAPLLAFNYWAFGSITHQSYNDTVMIAGQTGHDQLGANVNGFFGISVPSLNVLARLLLLNRGLFVTTPIVAAALMGLVLLIRRRTWRSEALLIVGVTVAYLIYNAGYYQPFGGDSAGPRFLMPILPFLVLPLAVAFERFPIATGSLGLISIVTMVAAATTQPMLQADDTRTWFSRVAHGDFSDSLPLHLGLHNRTLAILPALLWLLACLRLATSRTARPSLGRRDAAVAVTAVGVWAVLGSAIPPLLSSSVSQAASTSLALALFAAGAASVAIVARRPRAELSDA
ncbi:MAG: hypothetical protein QOH16_2288 [Gaiellaceae bacterium]|jgi:hypothetical protein|nr:hypothetical protein [Gaiellaceae bacterium]